jgi:small GTP-binding protein
MTSTMHIRTGPNAATTDYDVCVKSIIIGDSGVGKSSLLYRFSDQDWNPHYIATIGVDFKVMTFERSGKVVKLQLWDTAGQERFRTITHSYYRGAHGIMLVFDVTNAESFENIATWMKDVRKFGVDGVPMILVGNKTDCAGKRVVPAEQGEALAAQIGCKYVETSAKDNSKVEEAFTFLVDQCVHKRVIVPGKPLKPVIKLPLGPSVTKSSKDEKCAC